jgi:hypothetical protein
MTLDFVFKTCTGHDTSYWSGCGDLDWFSAYADPREDSGKGILTANWNHFPRSAARDSHRTEEGRKAQDFNWGKGKRFGDVLERMGYQLEWSDQTDRCSHCDGCIHTDAQFYGDTSHYAVLGECDVVCEACIRKDFAEEYLEGLEGNDRSAVNIRGINPAKYGYTEVQCGFESGFFPGQNDDPRKIKRELEARGYEGILFEISDSGQFDVHFCAWCRVTPVQAWLGDEENSVVYEGEPVPYEGLAV